MVLKGDNRWVSVVTVILAPMGIARSAHPKSMNTSAMISIVSFVVRAHTGTAHRALSRNIGTDTAAISVFGAVQDQSGTAQSVQIRLTRDEQGGCK